MKKFDPKKFKPSVQVHPDPSTLEQADSVMIVQDDGSLKSYQSTPEAQEAAAATLDALRKASKR